MKSAGQARQSFAKSDNLRDGRDASLRILNKLTCCEVAGEASLCKTAQTLKDGAEFCCRGSFSTLLYFVAEIMSQNESYRLVNMR